jgi:hypothetical protein
MNVHCFILDLVTWLLRSINYLGPYCSCDCVFHVLYNLRVPSDSKNKQQLFS